MAGLGSVLITRESSPAFRAKARARLCQWCNRPALKGKLWCKPHGPGRAADRRRRGGDAQAKRSRSCGQVLRETWAAKFMPAAFLVWPPVQRILAQPFGARAVPLHRIVSAALCLVAGDHAPWAECIGALRDAGLLLASDPPLVVGREGGGYAEAA